MSCTSPVLARESPLRTSSFPTASFVWPFLASVLGTFFPTLCVILEDSRTHHPALVRQCLLIVLLQLFHTFSCLLHLIYHPSDLHALLSSARLPLLAWRWIQSLKIGGCEDASHRTVHPGSARQASFDRKCAPCRLTADSTRFRQLVMSKMHAARGLPHVRLVANG
jgi:hypothetical protein